jgi:acetyl esterase/lipase
MVMSSRYLVDPQLEPWLDVLPTFELTADTLADVRAAMTPGIAQDGDSPNGIIKTQHWLCAAHGPDVRIVIYTPESTRLDRGCLLHIHGGGYIGGAPEIAEPRNCALSLEADIVVVSIDYRLAPEHPFPAAIDDCYAALAWVHEHASDLGVDSRRIAIAGESAGGGLAAALALLARDRGDIKPAFQLLIYPMLDDRTGITKPAPPMTGDFIWTPSSNRFGWDALLGHDAGGAGTSAYAAAARADDLAGLPSAFVVVGALDLFRDECIDYARRLMNASVMTELHVYPGAFHGFDLVADAGASRALYRDCLAAVRRAIG